MKIALVAHEIHDRGGMERCMANLARWLKAHGETVHLYTADASCPLVEEGFEWHHIPTVKKPLALRLWHFYQNSKSVIPFKDYDIVHANGGIIPAQTATTVHFCHAAWHEILKQPVFNEPYKGFSVWRVWNRKIAGIYATWLEKRAVRSSKIVTCVSQQTTNETVQYYQPKIAPHTVYNGVSISEFQPFLDPAEKERFRAEMGASPSDTVLLFVGGEFGRKGLPTILKSLKILQNPGVKLWVSGREPATDKFVQLAKDLNVLNQVSFLGFYADLPKLMNAADVFVFPSHYDSFGLVLTEAMASKLPVITTTFAGASELITHGENGFLLSSPEAAEELAQLITRIHNDPAFLEHVSDRALQTAKSYTWDRMSSEIYNHYCHLLGVGKVGAQP